MYSVMSHISFTAPSVWKDVLNPLKTLGFKDSGIRHETEMLNEHMDQWYEFIFVF